MMRTAVVEPEEQHFIVARLSPERVQRRLAVAVVLAMVLAAFITAGPLSSVRLPRLNAFIPAYATAMFVTGSITAILLFAQFSILRSRALLIIASGYLFTALVLIPWMLTFPGVFTPDGLLGAGLQSTVWLYVVWHAGFPLFVIAYAVSKDGDHVARLRTRSVAAAILASVALTALVVCMATWLVTVGEPRLPRLMRDTLHLSAAWSGAAAFTVLCIVVALAVLWARRRSVLDLWLMVVLGSYVIEICVLSFPIPARFSVGWYVGRIFGIVSGSLVLLVLLYEITVLYARLLRAVLAEHREREARLMTGDAVAATIAHEVKQPLASMIANSAAGVRWLEHEPPNIEEAKTAFTAIAGAGHRAVAVIDGVRSIFRKGALNRTLLDVNDLVAQALALARPDLQEHRILVDAEAEVQLPPVSGDRIQLQQVLLNLITNAVDAMAAGDGPRVLRVRSGVDGDGNVAVSVEDTGLGVAEQDVERIFNPLFTTKSGGMGMGLSICRSIIEAHDGRISVVPNHPRGAVFQVILLAEALTASGER